MCDPLSKTALLILWAHLVISLTVIKIDNGTENKRVG